MLRSLWLLALLGLAFAGCKKEPSDPTTDPGSWHFQFKFDASQTRLNNVGQPAPLPAGHAAQTPEFRKMSIHYLELASTAFTALGAGAVVYKAPETTKGGDNAIDFDKATLAAEGEKFLTIQVGDLPPGTYEWIRASVAYQNYDVHFNIKNLPVVGDLNQQRGTVASFLGFNTYITTAQPREKTLTVNDDKKQGFWAFETDLSTPYSSYNQLSSGEAPAGATTVVNPLFASSPIPAGSCVVTGKFAQPLVVTGKETKAVTITLSFSINQSFEWVDTNGNGQLDFYGDGVTPGEKIVDMGLRGLIPSWQ